MGLRPITTVALHTVCGIGDSSDSTGSDLWCRPRQCDLTPEQRQVLRSKVTAKNPRSDRLIPFRNRREAFTAISGFHLHTSLKGVSREGVSGDSDSYCRHHDRPPRVNPATAAIELAPPEPPVVRRKPS